MTTACEISSYESSAAVMSADARTALFKSAGQDWNEAKAAATKAGELELIAINRLRDCGLKLREASNHDRPSFEFWQRNVDNLPADMNFCGFRFCVSLSHEFDKPIEKLEEARQARRTLFEAFGHESAPRRLNQQKVHMNNPWSDFVTAALNLNRFIDCLEQEPMPKWSRDKLSTFVRTTKPLIQRHNQALELLG